jgi:glyoxylase-like metal-dependent hydrolase (beta-lactamase superfamily II)
MGYHIVYSILSDFFAINFKDGFMKMTLFPFTTGTYVVDQGTMDNIHWGFPYEHPLPVFAIRHPKGTVIFDTGHNHRGLSDPKGWYGKSIEKIIKINVTKDDCLPFQLQKAGIDPAEVTHVIMSHLHIDHTGEMMSFPKAQFIVRATELKYCWWPPLHQRYTYAFNDLKDTRFYNYLEIPDIIDFDVFQDGSLICIATPGHTPGHQSLIVRLPDYDKPFILCADACYTPFNLENNLYGCGLMWNTEAWFNTITKLKYYQNIGYELWFGHHMESWDYMVKRFG